MQKLETWTGKCTLLVLSNDVDLEAFRGITDTYVGVPDEWKSDLFLKLKHSICQEERRLQSLRGACKSQKQKNNAKSTATRKRHAKKQSRKSERLFEKDENVVGEKGLDYAPLMRAGEKECLNDENNGDKVPKMSETDPQYDCKQMFNHNSVRKHAEPEYMQNQYTSLSGPVNAFESKLNLE